jgi:flagellar motor switch protein FliM
MSDVLDQGEIDALLSALNADEGQAGAAPRPPGRAAGGEAVSEAPRAGPAHRRRSAAEAPLYDFKRPERVSKDQVRALASIHEVFARNFGATLSGLLRTIIDVRVVGVEQLTYNEFIHSLPNPTCFIVLEAPPLEGQLCLELSPLIVFPVIDRLLGGDNANLMIPQRPLTTIEWRLMGRIVDRALENLTDVWHNLVDARFGVANTESNPQLVHIVAPTEIVVFVTFEIKFGPSAGTMSFCIPYNTVESVLGHLNTQSWFYKPRAPTAGQQKRLLRNLVKSTVGVTVYLGRARLRLSDLRGLSPGDLIELEKRTESELILQVGGKTKFAARPGKLRGRRAVQVIRAAYADETL